MQQQGEIGPDTTITTHEMHHILVQHETSLRKGRFEKAFKCLWGSEMWNGSYAEIVLYLMVLGITLVLLISRISDDCIWFSVQSKP